MRVSFFGKGGSGKTTLSTAFIKYLNAKNKKVVAFDADVNVHLGRTLDMNFISLGEFSDQITYYLEALRNKPEKRTTKAGKKYYDFITKNEDLIVLGTLPPSYTSRFIKPDFNDPFLKNFATFKENICLLTLGTYNPNDVGYECYHSKLGISEMILNRFLDGKDMYVVTDSTAGVDSVGTSMFFESDINVFVVEPTLKSINVFKDFEEITADYDLKNYVIVNKITSEEDKEFVLKHIPADRILGFIENSKNLKKFEQGEEQEFDKFVDNSQQVYDKLLALLDSTEKDWDKYLKYLTSVYADNCRNWYSQYYGFDLEQFIDPDFDYKEVLKKC